MSGGNDESAAAELLSGGVQGRSGATGYGAALSDSAEMNVGAARAAEKAPDGDKPVDDACQTGLVAWFTTLISTFGYPVLILIFGAQHVLKGFVYSFTAAAEPYVYATYNVSAVQMQIYSGITFLPWSMKPIIGLVSDVFPIFGYRKAPYFIVATLLGSASMFAIGVIPQSALAVTMLVVCLFTATMQISTCDLLAEAKYSEKLRANPQFGPSLLTYVWFGMTAASLLASLVSGSVITYLGPTWPYLICAFPAAALLIPVYLGYLEETRLTSEEAQAIRAKFAEQKEACTLCVIMLVGSVAIIVVGLCYSSVGVNCAVALAVFVVLLIGFSLTLSPVIAKFNAFALLQTSLTWSISGATYYFYIDDEDAYPEGPHFSAVFYNSVLGTVGTLASLVGIATYNRYFSNWSYRSLLVTANIAVSFFGLLDVVMFSRLNKRIGIPDHVFVLGASCFEAILAQWQWMPQVVILSYFCPKGMEATLYALLAGCHNFGNTVASNCGAWLLQTWGVSPAGLDDESDQFTNLWKCALVVSFLPLISTGLLFWLIPSNTQSEMLVSDTATQGSLLRRWLELDTAAAAGRP